MRKLKTTELNRISLNEYKTSEKIPITVILDSVRSMLNVGSVFRTCDAFRIKKVLLCGITAQPPHREITKSALGATESVDWQYYDTAAEAIESLASNTRLLALEQVENSIPLYDEQPNWAGEYALVLGNEVDGVSDEALSLCHDAIEIPQFGTKHSLNISVSAGIALWHFVSQFKFE